MGDAGSLALGGAIGMLAVLTKAELLLPLIGGLYVVEARLGDHPGRLASRLTGRRVFRMAPLHHHYELSRVGRAEDRRPLLDRLVRAGAPGAHHPEAAVRMERAA